MQIFWKMVAVNTVQCLIRYNVHFKVSELVQRVATRCMQHVDSRRLRFSEHHCAKVQNANVFVIA